MILYTVHHTFIYECEKICRLYFPMEHISFASEFSEDNTKEDYVYTEISRGETSLAFFCRARIGSREYNAEAAHAPFDEEPKFHEEKQLARVMLKVLTELTDITPPWGILTGVRPSKLLRSYLEVLPEQEAKRIFTEDMLVSPKRTELACRVANAEEKCIRMSEPDSFSLYISIPFCPTRCSYCSFVSHSIGQAKKLLPQYVELLCEEIRQTAQIAKKLNLKLLTVYYGGGTPTSLSAEQLAQITKAVETSFDLSGVKEYTVEAGRPDTITEEKLRVLKAAGVDRISINPQTFSDSVLQGIGRNHTVADFYQKFDLARKIGFDNINTDLIAGLSGDSLSGFMHSIRSAVELSPENITVHTLALKRSATLVTARQTQNVCRETEQMVSYANTTLQASGYYPYYMYRQSKSVGNLENVGWCKPSFECLYNIYMMEEIHTVFACGGGAVTKLKEPNGPKIDRIYNFKYPYEYISRFDEQMARKQEALCFFQ